MKPTHFHVDGGPRCGFHQQSPSFWYGSRCFLVGEEKECDVCVCVSAWRIQITELSIQNGQLLLRYIIAMLSTGCLVYGFIESDCVQQWLSWVLVIHGPAPLSFVTDNHWHWQLHTFTRLPRPMRTTTQRLS